MWTNLTKWGNGQKEGGKHDVTGLTSPRSGPTSRARTRPLPLAGKPYRQHETRVTLAGFLSRSINKRHLQSSPIIILPPGGVACLPTWRLLSTLITVMAVAHPSSQFLLILLESWNSSGFWKPASGVLCYANQIHLMIN